MRRSGKLTLQELIDLESARRLSEELRARLVVLQGCFLTFEDYEDEMTTLVAEILASNRSEPQDAFLDALVSFLELQRKGLVHLT